MHVPVQVIQRNPDEALFSLLLHVESLNQSLLLSESLSRCAAILRRQEGTKIGDASP